MECCSCLLRFNLKVRAPLIISCGHSLCAQCLPSHILCPTCNQNIQPYPKPNYSLIQMLSKDSRTIDKFIKVCFVGSSAVGKTSLIRQFMGQEFSEDVATTIGFDFTFTDRVIGNYCVRFQLWDSAGQQRYRAISPIHYKNAHVVIIVYNVSSSAYDNRVAEWIEQTEKHAPPEALKIIIGNKLDLIEGKVCKPLDDGAWDLIKQKKIQCYETSCKNGAGIQQSWQVLENSFFNRREYNAIKPKQGTNQYNNVKIKQKTIFSDRQKSRYPAKNSKRIRSKKQQCC